MTGIGSRFQRGVSVVPADNEVCDLEIVRHLGAGDSQYNFVLRSQSNEFSRLRPIGVAIATGVKYLAMDGATGQIDISNLQLTK